MIKHEIRKANGINHSIDFVQQSTKMIKTEIRKANGIKGYNSFRRFRTAINKNDKN
jgi:hypothetical protein